METSVGAKNASLEEDVLDVHLHNVSLDDFGYELIEKLHFRRAHPQS